MKMMDQGGRGLSLSKKKQKENLLNLHWNVRDSQKDS